jgi:hypothetical protein
VEQQITQGTLKTRVWVSAPINSPSSYFSVGDKQYPIHATFIFSGIEHISSQSSRSMLNVMLQLMSEECVLGNGCIQVSVFFIESDNERIV